MTGRSRKTRGRKITVAGNSYLWGATGNDGYVVINIRPFDGVGARIIGYIRYHETWLDKGDGRSTSAGDQIIITGRLVRRVVEHAISVHRYDPAVRAGELNLGLDDVIPWDDAIRAEPKNEPGLA